MPVQLLFPVDYLRCMVDFFNVLPSPVLWLKVLVIVKMDAFLTSLML